MTADFAPFVSGTLPELLRRLARHLPEHEALVCPAFTRGGTELRLSFAALDARVDAIARGLIAAGVQPGQHVALWAATLPDWVALEFALARIGAVLVTVNTALKRAELAYLLAQSRAVAVIHTTRTGSNEASAELDALLAAEDPAVAGLKLRIWLASGPDDEPPLGVLPGGGRGALLDLEQLVARGSEPEARAALDAELARREAAVHPEDIVNIQYTSGTTGFPKGVMLRHRNVLHSGFCLGRQLETTPADRIAVMVPLFHCFGCVVCVLGAFQFGATLCLLPGFEPGAALRLIEEERCTLLHGVPTMFGAMLAHPDCGRRDTSSLRAGLAAGAPCPPALMTAIVERLGCRGMAVTYGLTEASPGVSGSSPQAPLAQRTDTIGAALPDVELRIVDPVSLRDLPPDQPGELLVRGPNVMAGYHDDPQATARAITPDGWLRTGDQCVRDADGLLRVSGRIKDIIIRGGENLAPAEIEAALREHPDVLDAAVFGVPDPRFGEEVAVAVILRDGFELDPAALAGHLKPRLAAFKIPKLWHRVSAFPLTGSGKVQKYRLREIYGARDAVTPDPAR